MWRLAGLMGRSPRTGPDLAVCNCRALVVTGRDEGGLGRLCVE